MSHTGMEELGHHHCERPSEGGLRTDVGVALGMRGVHVKALRSIEAFGLSSGGRSHSRSWLSS